jgi:hypothetical protein
MGISLHVFVWFPSYALSQLNADGALFVEFKSCLVANTPKSSKMPTKALDFKNWSANNALSAACRNVHVDKK